jgi:rare lipoprotein A
LDTAAVVARLRRVVWIVCLLGVSACAARAPEPAPPPAQPPAQTTAAEQPSFTQTGLASWYGAAHQGHKTASGERFDQAVMTAAHMTLPLGTLVRVTSVDTGKSVKVRINDRGPHAHGRIIDLSAEAAAELNLRQDGDGPVKLEVFASDQ